MKKEFYLYVNGQKVKVSEDIYKVYWREKEHEKYLEQVDRKNHLLFFSSLDHDGNFVDNIADESVDVAKIVETQMMIEAVRNAISRLNAEERDIIERLYFNDETVVLLSKLNTEHHLDIEIGEDELSEIDFSKDATYGEIKKYVLDKYGLKVSSLYIAQIKRKHGLIERENYNFSKKENQRVPNCPEEKEKAIEDALEHFGMI